MSINRDFPLLKNDRILKAARGEIPDKLPVWVMRQAGRYLPEFQEYRKKYNFFEICQNPEHACAVTLMPLERFELDAAIIFSDILVIPQALGIEVEMVAGVGPVLPHPITPEAVSKLSSNHVVEKLEYVGKAINLTRHKLNGRVPLFGFTGAPWTLMGYMIEGGGSKTYSKAKKWLYAYPEEAHALLNVLTEVIVDYLVMQIEFGAQIVQVFDSNAEYLNKKLYSIYGLPYLKRISVEVREKLKLKNLEEVPMVLFAKGGWYCLEEQAELGYEVLGIDWTIEPQFVRKLLHNKKITLQGNLDPTALYAPKSDLKVYIERMLEEFGSERYIVNLGHGIYPDAPVESVEFLVDTVHNFQI
ncbi:hypothetical protein ABEB36_011454 [Hypothenemus hampei]|uniref:Uroporphyrinogen decarboxylase n=1 Tax=Hypothenemus hampei TaxID=57062 RepID=A0ABD1EFU1_HYPHA